MKKILLVSEDVQLDMIPFVSAFSDTKYTVEKMGIGTGSTALKTDKEISAVLFDTPSNLPGVQELIDYVNGTNSYVRSIPILILTDSSTLDADLAYLGDAVIDCIQKPVHPLILRNRLQWALRASNSTSFSDFSKMLTALPTVVYLKDTSGRYAFSSHALHHLTVSDPDEVRGKTDLEVRRDKENAKLAMEADQALLASGKGTSYIIEEAEDGHTDYLEIIKEPLYYEDGRQRGIIGLVINVTEQERLRRELRYLSTTDQLTNLYNRSFYSEYTTHQLKNAVYPVSVITADCDQLKWMNDTYGHLEGDEYIRMTAAVLRSCLPKNAVIARVGGDEFTAFLPDTTTDQAKAYIKDMKETMVSFQVRDHELSISFGCSTLLSPSDDVEACITAADDEMYRDKTQRKKQRQ